MTATSLFTQDQIKERRVEREGGGRDGKVQSIPVVSIVPGREGSWGRIARRERASGQIRSSTHSVIQQAFIIFTVQQMLPWVLGT